MLNPNASTGYSISRDGNRFLFLQPVQPDPPITQIQMVVNWFAELRRAAGTKWRPARVFQDSGSIDGASARS